MTYDRKLVQRIGPLLQSSSVGAGAGWLGKAATLSGDSISLRDGLAVDAAFAVSSVLPYFLLKSNFCSN